MTRTKKFATLSAILAVAAVIGYQLNRSESGARKPPAPRASAIPVVTAKVEQRDLPIRIDVVGRAEALSTVSIRARIDGQIATVELTPGQHVKAGQVLARLDTRPLVAQLRQVGGNLARDKALLAKAKADLERYADLSHRGFVSPSAVDGYRASVDTADATVAIDEAAVEFAKVQLGFSTITAPMNGVAGALQVFPGATVKANDTVIVVINQLTPLLVTFAVPEVQLPGLREVAARGPVVVDGQPKDPTAPKLFGKLVFIDNAVDTSTGTIVLKAQFANSNEAWTPGQFVDVSLTTKVLKDVRVVPIEAVQMGPSGNILFVIGKDGKAEVRPVKSFFPAGKFAVLKEGFEVGETVVIDGQLRLSPGAQVQIKDDEKSGIGRDARL